MTEGTWCKTTHAAGGNTWNFTLALMNLYDLFFRSIDNWTPWVEALAFGAEPQPKLPKQAVVVGSSYVTTDIIFENGKGYAPIADLCKMAGWDVEFKKTADGLRWYPKHPDWKD